MLPAVCALTLSGKASKPLARKDARAREHALTQRHTDTPTELEETHARGNSEATEDKNYIEKNNLLLNSRKTKARFGSAPSSTARGLGKWWNG